MQRKNVSQAEADYLEKHWGLAGERAPRKMNAPDPAFGVATTMGKLVAITYRTRKSGDGSEEVDYEHEFGKGDGRGACPWLAYNDTGLLILGGGYTVTYRGIVG